MKLYFLSINVDLSKCSQCLLAVLENWKKLVDKSKAFVALMANLSIAFDCLDHELFIAKQNVYDFALTNF